MFTLDIETTGLINGSTHPDIVSAAIAMKDQATTFHEGNIAKSVYSFAKGMNNTGLTMVTFNGAKFDLEIIQHHLGFSIQEMIDNHIDLMKCIQLVTGKRISQSRLEKENGLQVHSMSGKDVPLYFAQGRMEEILRYNSHDAENLLNLAILAKDNGGLYVSSRRFVSFDLLTVGELNE